MSQNSTSSEQKPPFVFFKKILTTYYELKSDLKTMTGKYCPVGSSQVYDADGLVRS